MIQTAFSFRAATRAVPLAGRGRSVMKFQVIYRQASGTAQSPVRIIEQPTGRGIGWVNRYLDREYVRRLADRSLRVRGKRQNRLPRWLLEGHHPAPADQPG